MDRGAWWAIVYGITKSWTWLSNIQYLSASQVALMVKNSLANAGDVRDVGLIPGSERSPGGGHANPLQYSFWRIPWTRGALQDTVYRVTKSWTRLKQLSTYVPPLVLICDLMKGSQIPADDKRK